MIQAPVSMATRLKLVDRVKLHYPNEACGFIMASADPDTRDFIFDVPNVAKRPEHQFQMDEGYLRLAYSDESNIVGMWHTHPNGPDGPSTTDLKFMPPGLRYFVVTLNGVFEYDSNDIGIKILTKNEVEKA